MVHEATLKLGPSDQNERDEFSSNQSQTYKHTTYHPRLSLPYFPLVVEELKSRREREAKKEPGIEVDPDKPRIVDFPALGRSFPGLIRMAGSDWLRRFFDTAF